MSVLAKIGQSKLGELEQFLPDVWKTDSQHEPTPGGPITVSQTAPA